MLLHQLHPQHKIKKKKRVGRGGKRGTYSGRGQKGQKARAGRNIKPQFREQLLKIPKRRGFKFTPTSLRPAVVNIKDITRHFQEGEKVTPRTLLEKGLVSKAKGKIPAIKILGQGTIAKPLLFEKVAFSQKAKEQILHAGGTIAQNNS